MIIAQSDETVGVAFLAPRELWRQVRNIATDERVSAQSLWIQAMEEFVERRAA